MARLADYVELHCRSHFTFLTGASQPKALVERAHALGYAGLALTDECSLSGVVHAHERALELGLPLIIGAEMRFAAGPGDAPMRLVLLATSRRGYGNLSQWITAARRRAPKGRYEVLAADLEGRLPHLPHLAGLPGCLALLVPTGGTARPPAAPATRAGAGPQQPPAPEFDALLAQARWLQAWFGAERAWLALPLLLREGDAELRDRVLAVAAATGLAVVATGDVLMATRAAKPLQDLLTATRLQCTVAEGGTGLEPNAEAHLRGRARLQALYEPAWLAESVRIAGLCTFSLKELRYEYPQEIVPEGHTPTSWLRALTEAGALRRFPGGVSAKVRAQLEHELALVAQLAYEPYFLTVADLVQWARAQGILCQGRGSAANSAVCYCLGVTEVDPDRMQVLFERFISAERNEPPDIDIDFEHQRREEVIQYLYRKYGRHRAALTAVMIRYRLRSAVRDAGRALGFEIDRVDAVTRALHSVGGAAAPSREQRLALALAEQGFDPASPLCARWIDLSQQLLDVPRHLSQHPGGFVIARDDVARLVPVENAAMEGRTVIQWDKDDLDALGLLKVDVLALGMLSAIRRALDFIGAKTAKTTHGGASAAEVGIDAAAFRMQDIPPDDPAVYRMLQAGDSIGVFQVESRAQMSMLPRLKPACFYDLVIEVAIVRPGPIQGGMVHPYLRRREGLEPADYPSPEVRQALARTLGVPIFQEQVMQLAILAADFTPGEADRLRRAMAAWKRKGGLGPFHERLVGRMVAKGYALEYAEAIFRQIEGFGEYGFPESHAASFALLVYASAWIKRHHADAFLAALLNSLPMGFYAPAQLVRDARDHGVTVRPVDVAISDWDSTLEALPAAASAGSPASAPALHAVRLGLGRVSGLGEAVGRRIVAARAQAPAGRFASVEDLARRAALDAGALQALAAADALIGLAGSRRDAAWAVAGVDTRATPLLAATRTAEPTAPQLEALTAGDVVVADYRALGLSLLHHPVGLLRAALAPFRVVPAARLNADGRAGQLARASGLVTHRQQPETAKGVVFVTLEDETGAVNVIVWPAVAAAQRRPLLAATLLTVYGIWQREGEVRHLIARTLVDHSALLQGLTVRSRDFH